MNGQSSDWMEISAGVPQGSILGPLFFLIYINDLPEGLVSRAKIFADDTSLFSLVLNLINSSQDLDHDLCKISEWAYQWKMSFNPDPSKQAVEVYFTRKLDPPNPPTLFFNNSAITIADSQKHLVLILDKKLAFGHHLKEKLSKANKGIGLINRLRKFLPRDSLFTIYKAFVRPHLDYGDIIYDHPGNASFSQKLESIQYNACLAITGCFRGTSREKLYSELGLESLSDRRHRRRLIFFYKIVKGFAPKYLSEYIPAHGRNFANLRTRPALYPFYARTDRFRASFFPYCISEWNKLDGRIRNLPSISSFKRALFEFLRPKADLIFKVTNNHGVVLLNRLRVGFSHLREHKFRHNFA
ncbi:MAG: reverse transcriptase domain-containing protein, partial [Pseudomonadota bacterium]